MLMGGNEPYSTQRSNRENTFLLNTKPLGKNVPKCFFVNHFCLYCVLNCFITNLPQGEENARPDGITAS